MRASVRSRAEAKQAIKSAQQPPEEISEMLYHTLFFNKP